MSDKKVVGGKRLRIRKLGLGGTMAEFERTGNKPDVKVKWKVGSVSGAGKGNRKKRKHGPSGKGGQLRQKSAPGFGISVQF